MKLYQQLEQSLKVRINSNDEIIPALKNLMEKGYLDKPKEIAMFAIILDRLGKIEDEMAIEQSLRDITDTPVNPSSTEAIQSEINTEKANLETTVLENTDNPMTGVDEIIPVTTQPEPETPVDPMQGITVEMPTLGVEITPRDEPTVSTFTPEAVVNPEPTTDTAPTS